MSSNGSDNGQDIELRDEVPLEDALEQSQDAGPDEEENQRYDEGDFPDDAVGLDGTPVDQILQEREERLDPENRPENSEVSNAGREFDMEKGMFTDEPGYDEAEKKWDTGAV
ncbi:hypothetical protein [Nocardioides pelophilus]|uniref:hypothetical protein n=1 Tax=Nocardioides pelophilus TaxID=2172019 RepID=UPI001603232E|nr:hypothetical protein [Nocardioides pelophilus]